MSTIYKPNRSAYWWASIGSGRGRVRFSLKVRHNGHRTPPKAVWELLAARELQIERAKAGLAPDAQSVPLKQFFNDYITGLNCRGSSQTRYGHAAKSFVDFCAERGAKDTNGVTERLARDYVTHLIETKASGTAKWEADFLKRAWEEGKRLNYCQFTTNPFHRKIKVTRGKRSYFTPDEIAKIYAADWPQWLHTACRIAHGSGRRISEIQGLTCGDVDFNANVLTVKKSKTDGFQVPLLPELAGYLRQLVKDGSFEAPYTILPQSVCERPSSYISQEFTRRAKKLGINGTFHWWRHTFVSELANMGVAKNVIMMLTHHKSAAVNEIYTHMDAKKLAESLRK